ncbi:MAG: DUF5989 family protein [Candidatus Hydrogenedentes bacterium]|nr:DUF5989 family protein [Candidatus Hydrogenedentota bacterium]
MEFVKEIWAFLRVRKKFWLAPIIFALLILGFLFVVVGPPTVSGLIYAL